MDECIKQTMSRAKILFSLRPKKKKKKKREEKCLYKIFTLRSCILLVCASVLSQCPMDARNVLSRSVCIRLQVRLDALYSFLLSFFVLSSLLV